MLIFRLVFLLESHEIEWDVGGAGRYEIRCCTPAAYTFHSLLVQGLLLLFQIGYVRMLDFFAGMMQLKFLCLFDFEGNVKVSYCMDYFLDKNRVWPPEYRKEQIKTNQK